MNSINEKLAQMYSNEQARIKDFKEKCVSKLLELQPESDATFAYHYTYATEQYCNADTKILVIGQELNDWDFAPDGNVADSMEFTNHFQTAQGYYNSAFWQYVKQLGSSFNGENYHTMHSVAWTNILKLCGNTDPKFLINNAPQLLEEYCITFDTVKNEIEILAPDVVIFLTGPTYNKWIELQFDGVKYLPVDDNFNTTELARLEHKHLPVNTYVTYHPGYTARNRDKLWTPVIECIVSNSK